MADLAKSIDEITPHGRHNGGAVLSTWAWAAHRYVMAGLIGFVVICAVGLLHDHFAMRLRMTTLERSREDKVYDHENRLTKLEESREAIMGLLNRMATDNRKDSEAIQAMKSDIEIIKVRMQQK